MNGFSAKLKTTLFVLIFFSMISTGLASSNWTIEKKDTLSRDTVSPNSPTIQVVNITADVTDSTIDDPDTKLNPTDLEPSEIEEANITHQYNATNGTAKDLTHWKDGLWYASFEPNTTKGSQINYTANGTTSVGGIVNSNGTANLTENLTLGNYTVQLQNDYSNSVKAGREFEMEVSVTNVSNDATIDDSIASVQVYFENDTKEVKRQNIDNYDNGEFYNSRVTYPDNPDSSYIMHVTAEADNSYANGSTSRILDIAPQVQGEISQFSSENGCSNQSMVGKCEQNATVDIEYDITNSQAQNVNLSLYAFNNSDRHMIQSMNLTDEGGLFTGKVNVPDLNTSKYIKEMELVFNATNNYRRHVDRRNMTLKTFKIQDRSPPTTYLGQNYKMDIFLGKPYSLGSYSLERFNNVTINVTDSSNNHVQTFSKKDLTYSESSGIMEATILIDDTYPTGNYGLDIQANNTYGVQKTKSSGFSVKDVDATFEAEDNLEWNVNRLEQTKFTISIENLLQSKNNLNHEITQLDDQLSLTNNNIELAGGSTEEVEVKVNLTELKDTQGSIKFMDANTNYNQTVDIQIDAPNCQIQVGELCSETNSVNTSTTSKGNYTETLELRYIGEQDSSLAYNTTVEGNIGPYLSVQDEGNVATINGQKDVTLTFYPETTGTFNGQIVFDTGDEELSVPVELVYTSGENEEGESSNSNPKFSLSPSSVDLGTVVDGEEVSTDVDITNNGVEITSISADSSTYEVSTDSKTISKGSTSTATLTFSDVDSSSGTVEITASSSGGETTETLSVSVSPVQDYGERASELRSQLRELQSVASTEQQGELTEASTQISQLETAWDAGNYEEAESKYQEISTTLNSIESETTTSPAPEPDQNQEQDGSGGSLLPIVAIVVILLLVVGFVIYTSYIPEEGDPLYSVLGEGQ